MLVNLHRPYEPTFSASKDNMTFYNKVNDDFIFGKDDEIEIYVAPTRKTMKLNWKLTRNMVDAPLKEGYAKALPGYVFAIKIDTKNLESGFYDIYCEAEFGTGATALSPCSSKAYCTFGYDIDNMPMFIRKPDDFEAFWEKSKEKIKGVELEPQFGEVYTFKDRQINDYNVSEASFPCSYDEEGILYDEVIAYKVSFKSAGGMRIYGWFARPKKEGKYPGLMIYPGAGYHSRSMPLEHARHGYAALDIQVHGQDCDWPKEKYVPTPPLDEFPSPLDGENYYFNDIYMHALQGLNMLCSMDCVDTDRIAVCGGSQGGRLSMVASALDKRVKAAVIGIPHYNGQNYLEWTFEANRRKINGEKIDMDIVDSHLLDCIAYYDTTNFAPMVKCPVFCGCGLVDKVSPATCVRTLFNNLGTDNKTYLPSPQLAHDWDAQFDREAWKWLKEVL